MKKIILRIIFIALTLLWMAVIFLMSSKDATESEHQSHRLGRFIGRIVYSDFSEWSEQEQLAFAKKVDHPIRKGAHASEYALLGILMMLALLEVKRLWQRALFSFGGAVLYAISDEIHQMFVPGRACRFTDVCIDAAGATVGIGLMCLVFFLCRRRKLLTMEGF